MNQGFGNLMQQAQKMQRDLQKKLAEMEVVGESGGGMVKVTVNGRHEARRVEIDPAAMDDREMLEDLVAAAINDAERKIESQSQSRMSEMFGGLNLPPGFKPPF